MSLACTHCQSPIEPSAVDEARQIATCGACGRIVDLQLQLAESAAKPRLRTPVDLPAGMTMRRWWEGERGSSPGGLEIKRRWLRGKHYVFLAVVTCLSAGIAYLWSSGVEPKWLVIAGGFFVATFAIRVVRMFVNSTTIEVLGDRVEVRHGPFPSILFRNQSVAGSDLKQLYAAKWGALYEVGAELNDGTKLSLVRPLVSEAQALFVEQCLENQLGIVDFEVEGELESAGSPAALSTGAGGAVAIVPVVVLLTVFLFVTSMSSSLEGSLTLGEDLGNVTFTPDSCESGQLQGFLGVELSSKAAPGVVVRAMRDPTRGTLIVVEQGGGKPTVLTPEGCTSMQVAVSRTGTNINEVWVVQGTAAADCPGLKGTVTFDGCH